MTATRFISPALTVMFMDGTNSTQPLTAPCAPIVKLSGVALDVLTDTELSAYPPLRTLPKDNSAGLIPMLAASAGWDGPASGDAVGNALDRAHALRRPDEKRKLFKGERLGRKRSPALALGDHLPKRHVSDGDLVGRDQVDELGVGSKRLLRRRARHALLLVGLLSGIAPFFPVGFEKSAAFFGVQHIASTLIGCFTKLFGEHTECSFEGAGISFLLMTTTRPFCGERSCQLRVTSYELGKEGIFDFRFGIGRGRVRIAEGMKGRQTLCRAETARHTTWVETGACAIGPSVIVFGRAWPLPERGLCLGSPACRPGAAAQAFAC